MKRENGAQLCRIKRTAWSARLPHARKRNSFWTALTHCGCAEHEEDCKYPLEEGFELFIDKEKNLICRTKTHMEWSGFVSCLNDIAEMLCHLSVSINPILRKISFWSNRRPLLSHCPPRRRRNEIFRRFYVVFGKILRHCRTGAAENIGYPKNLTWFLGKRSSAEA